MATRTRPPQAAKETKPKPTRQKDLFHGELRERGPTLLTVKSAATQSKDKAWRVEVVDAGAEREYVCENKACIGFFFDKLDKEVVVLAQGSRDDATLTDVTEVPPPTEPPKAAPAQATARRHSPAPHDTSKPGTQAARTATTVTATQPVHKPVEGMEAGMCLKEAIGTVNLLGVDPTKPEYFKMVHEVASDFIRVSQMLRRGELAPSAKARANGGVV